MSNLDLLREGKIWVYRNKIFLTDPPGSTIDAVFPFCHENQYFVDHLVVSEEGLILDLCTGAGILALFAAGKAKKVIATDINSRALEFAQLNAVLNGVENKIEFRQGNLWEPVEKEKFDLIVANPPFEPRSLRPLSKLLHSDGGAEGTAIIQRIIKGVPSHLALNGSFQMIIWLLEKRLKILDDLKNGCFDKIKIDELDKWKTNIGLVYYLFVEALNFRGGDKK